MAAERYEPEEARQKWTVEEYLEFNARAEWNYEFIGGRVTPVEYPNFEIEPGERPDEAHIRAMSGSRKEHYRVKTRLPGLFDAQLADSTCEPMDSDAPLKLNSQGQFAYPDLMIACDPEFERRRGLDAVLNPTVIIEVLSPSTQRNDRTIKLALYQQLPSLRDYLMISTDEPRIEWYSRDDAAWIFRTVEGLDAELQLSSIKCTLRLRDVYKRLSFDSGETR